MCSKCNVYLCKEHFAAYHFGGIRMTRWMSPKLFAVQLCRITITAGTMIYKYIGVYIGVNDTFESRLNKTGQNKTSSFEKIWFRDTHDFSFWHACQVCNLMWVGLKRIGHIANTTHLIPLGEACAMILVD